MCSEIASRAVRTLPSHEKWRGVRPKTGYLENCVTEPFQNFTTVSTKGYDDFTDFLEDTKNSDLEYIVVEDRSTIFESINKNEKEYTYLEKVFDSKELDLKNMFKIYKINYKN